MPIELVEVPPPSLRLGSVSCSTSAASTSYASTSSSAQEEELETDCSSEFESEQDAAPRHVVADSFNARMCRIEQWRDTYAKAVGAELGQ